MVEWGLFLFTLDILPLILIIHRYYLTIHDFFRNLQINRIWTFIGLQYIEVHININNKVDNELHMFVCLFLNCLYVLLFVFVCFISHLFVFGFYRYQYNVSTSCQKCFVWQWKIVTEFPSDSSSTSYIKYVILKI